MNCTTKYPIKSIKILNVQKNAPDVSCLSHVANDFCLKMPAEPCGSTSFEIFLKITENIN